MRIAKRWLAVALALATGLAHAQTPKETFDPLIDAVMARYRLPGLAVGVIDHGEVIYKRTAGELARGSGQPVTPDALFKIASNSKAMTATLLARLVQQGKLRWDDPVTRYLPAFRMFDPWVTQHMQVGDLLTHRSGLREGAGDLMLWPEPNHFTRTDIVSALAWLKPAYSFRAGYAYDNLLYVVAGEVAAVAGGAPYETLLKREVFEPLGLSRCQVGEWRRDAMAPVALPHAKRDDAYMPSLPDDPVVHASTMEAAGGVQCSLNDMLIWAHQWLAPTPQQLAWLPQAQRDKLWTPYTPMPISAQRRAWDGTRLYAYGYGWRIADVDGALTVSHTGTLSGMYSALYLLPDRQSGFVVLINGDADDARTVLIEVLLKHFTAQDKARSVASYADELAAKEHSRRTSHVPDTSTRRPASATELRSQLGVWRDPWFGDITLCPRDGGVIFAAAKSPRLRGPVMRVGQRYLVQWEHGDEEAWLAPPTGKTGLLHLSKIDPDADFSYDYEDLAFKHVRGCE
ncbi:CubicO group peptidase, beta-lactamase class C family [Dyella sp. OK004]|uniref:serine hydrolase domain-containing protein n=1 Tax=Dyella sp. OK004 TaxID=1855292 RepID=UPI0008EFAF03|nr:CubicO group peptidase, beta-lactamase class C family [Dyella sp. OK004]